MENPRQSSGQEGHQFEEAKTGIRTYALTVPRESGLQPPISWELALPVIPVDWNGSEQEIKKTLSTHRKSLSKSLRECVEAFHPARNAGWTDKEYATLKSKIDSLLWAPMGEWLANVHETLCRIMGTDEGTDLRFYPALGTSADIHHQIDQFAVFKTQEERRILLTIDYSKQTKESFEADILVTQDGAYLNPAHFAAYSPSPFVLPFQEDESKDVKNRRTELVARAMAAALDVKNRELSHKRDASFDGHYDLYPLERTILVDEKVQTKAARDLTGMRFMNSRHIEEIMSGPEPQPDVTTRKKKNYR